MKYIRKCYIVVDGTFNEGYDIIKIFDSFTKAEKDPYLVVENYFIPLLFLVQDHKIDAWQEEFFSEIFIKVL